MKQDSPTGQQQGGKGSEAHASFKEMRKFLCRQEKTPRKILERKSNSSMVKGYKYKNVTDPVKEDLVSPKYMINTPLKLVIDNESSSTKNGTEGQITQKFFEKKTMRQDAPIIKEENRSKSRRPVEETSDYYKFWNKKANEYQERNFSLERLNSALKQQNEILKHQNKRLEKKLGKISDGSSSEPMGRSFEHAADYRSATFQKIEECYKNKIEELTVKIEEQEILIARQDKKIKQLSKYLTQNYELKSLLDNMEEKVSERSFLGTPRKQLNNPFSDKRSERKAARANSSYNSISRFDRTYQPEPNTFKNQDNLSETGNARLRLRSHYG